MLASDASANRFLLPRRVGIVEIPATRLFHLHYNVPNVRGAERRLADFGLPLHQRFGQVRGESVAFDPDGRIPDGFRLRLQTHQRGYANVTLAPGRELRFDHLELRTAEFDSVVGRAESRGWSVRDPDGRRPFVMTPWGFRVEVHRDGSAVESELGDRDEAHLSAVDLRAPNPDAVRDGLRDVFGGVPGLAVRDGDGRAFAASFRLDGEAFGGRVTDATALGTEDADADENRG